LDVLLVELELLSNFLSYSKIQQKNKSHQIKAQLQNMLMNITRDNTPYPQKPIIHIPMHRAKQIRIPVH